MADSELAAITEDTSVATDDQFYGVDAGGTTDKRFSAQTLADGFASLAGSGDLPWTLIAEAQVQSGSGSANSYDASSATLIDLDATNLKVTGTVPSTGKLLIRLSGVAGSQAGSFGYWGLRTASGIVSNTKRFAIYSNGLASGWTEMSFRITGLTPGAAFDYRWAVAGSYIITTGTDMGPARIEAFVAA